MTHSNGKWTFALHKDKNKEYKSIIHLAQMADYRPQAADTAGNTINWDKAVSRPVSHSKSMEDNERKMSNKKMMSTKCHMEIQSK